MEAHKHLDDTTCYKKSNQKVVKETFKRHLMKWKRDGLISNDEFLFLNNEFPVTPVMYFIPKIHKKVSPIPGRPIISANCGRLEKASQYVDFYLQEFVTALPSYIRDASDFLGKLSVVPWSESCMLITLAITALYTSINHLDGLKAVEHYLNKRAINMYQHNAMILEMINFCLHNNYFLFDKEVFQQLRGVAMGACFSRAMHVCTLGAGRSRFFRWFTNPIGMHMLYVGCNK